MNSNQDADLEFKSPVCAAKFRRSLKNVPSAARIESNGGMTTLLVRPNNLLEFGASLNRRGMDKCTTSNRILQHLNRHKEEFIRFEHQEN